MKRLAISTRNGRPAYEDAPPRLRQSQCTRPVQPMPQPGFFTRIFGGYNGA